MKNKWTLNNSFTQPEVEKLYTELIEKSKNTKGHEAEFKILATLLVQRGIKTIPQAAEFNNFSKEKLHDPFLMLGMDKAVQRILDAISSNQKIMVYGDYDVDGTTSVALMITFLKELTSNLTYYIPDRYAEGYGISIKGIDTAKNEGAALIIALDCGIKAIDKIEHANKIGVDFIICDHHTPGEKVPNCIAVLDPKQKNCEYPYKELSGAAIGYKLCQALATKANVKPSILTEILDLTVISLACDIVPLTGENRVLSAMGLQQINLSPRLSITSLLGEKESTQQYTISDLVFKAGPKINAAGRISSGKQAVDLLLATEKDEIEKFTSQINEYNTSRKEEDKKITIEALQMIKNDPSLQSKNSNVLYKEDWHKGVVGIVASRVIEHYYKPTIILTKSSQGILGGSVRSVKGFNVYNALEACQNEILQFGGHKYAAGLTLKESQLHDLTQKFEEVVSNQMEVPKFIPEVKYDAEIKLSSITFKLKQFIDKLSPFGPQNMTPTFVTRNVVNAGGSRSVGDGSHLKLDIKHPNTQLKVAGIAFGLGEHAKEIQLGTPFNIIYTIDVNYWKDTQTLQVMVRDIKF